MSQWSISTSFDYSIPIEAQVPLIVEAGFTHISLGAQEAHSGYLSEARRRRLQALLHRHGLHVDTIHGPRADQPDSLEMLTATAAAASDLSAPVVVIHGGPFHFEEAELPARLKRLLSLCRALGRIASRAGVVFALENVMPGPATELVRLALAELDPRHFGFCYDSSHDQIGGPRPFDLLAELGHRLAAVHLSDRAAEFVDHLIPGEGFIDWAALCRLLGESSFRGPLLLEVLVTHSTEKEARLFLKLAYERGYWLSDQLSG